MYITLSLTLSLFHSSVCVHMLRFAGLMNLHANISQSTFSNNSYVALLPTSNISTLSEYYEMKAIVRYASKKKLNYE